MLCSRAMPVTNRTNEIRCATRTSEEEIQRLAGKTNGDGQAEVKEDSNEYIDQALNYGVSMARCLAPGQGFQSLPRVGILANQQHKRSRLRIRLCPPLGTPPSLSMTPSKVRGGCPPLAMLFGQDGPHEVSS